MTMERQEQVTKIFKDRGNVFKEPKAKVRLVILHQTSLEDTFIKSLI